MFISLLYTVTLLLASPSEDPKLDYSSTLNKSMSKFQRINHIEGYLEKLKDGVQNLDDKSQVGVKGDIKVLKANIALIEKKMEIMSKDLEEIKEILKPTKKTKD